MAKRRRSTLRFSPQQAGQALAFLIHEGKIATREVQKALQRREYLVRELKSRLSELGEQGTAAGKRLGRTAARKWRTAQKASRPARKRAVSAAVRAARRTQGKYMAALRPLSKDARKRIKSLREKSGVKAAIAAAKRMAK